MSISKASVYNLCDYPLTDGQAIALAHGLNFIPLPKKHKKFKNDTMKEFDNFAKLIRTRKYFAENPTKEQNSLYLPLKYKVEEWEPPIRYENIERYLQHVKHNLLAAFDLLDSFQFRSNPAWLENSIRELLDLCKTDIVVKNADKNMGVTVQSRAQYERDCLSQLNDIHTYRPIDRNTVNFSDLFDQLSLLLQKHNQMYITYSNNNNTITTTHMTKVAKYILQMNNEKAADNIQLARFYLIYKVHKPVVVGRPICSNIDTVTYFASKYVDKKLQPAMKLAKSYVDSSESVVLLLDTYQVNPWYHDNFVIVCADVTNLYPSIPIKIGISFMRDRLIHLFESQQSTHNRQLFNNKEEIYFLCELTEWILEHNYIEFGNTTYQQMYGTAMGTPVAVVFANLFLQQLEHIVRSKIPADQLPILFKRYIDDIMSLFKCKQHATQFITMYNSIVETIKLTHSVDSKEGIFLDLIIVRGPDFENTNKLDVKLYQKPQNKYLYLPPNSFHDRKVFGSFINSELNRIRLNCSVNDDFETNKQLFRQRLLARDHDASTLDKIFAIPRNRLEMIRKIRNRIMSKNYQPTEYRANTITPAIFKSIHSQELQQFKPKLKHCLKLTTDASNDPHARTIFGNKHPIICQQSSPNLGKIFTKSKFETTTAIK